MFHFSEVFFLITLVTYRLSLSMLESSSDCSDNFAPFFASLSANLLSFTFLWPGTQCILLKILLTVCQQLPPHYTCYPKECECCNPLRENCSNIRVSHFETNTRDFESTINEYQVINVVTLVSSGERNIE